MRVRLLALSTVILLVLAPPRGSRADTSGFPDADRVLCDMATSDAEHETGVPDELLTAISRVETGRRDPDSGAMRSWPWTIDVEGQGHFYATKAEAIAAVRDYQAGGARSIDVGCMQVNLLQHPDAFGSLDDAFDPRLNALWAARFLTGLFRQTGSWPHAAAAYHSMTPDIGADYQEQVLRMWAEGNGPPDASRRDAARQASRLAAAPSPTGSGPGPGSGTETSSPFGADRAPVVTARYNPSGMPSQGGRGLAAYRAMPIAMSGRSLLPDRFRGS